VASAETLKAEDEILNIFVDICSLFQRDPEVNHRASGEEPARRLIFSPTCAGWKHAARDFRHRL